MAYPIALLGIAKSAALVTAGLFLVSQSLKRNAERQSEDPGDSDDHAIDLATLEAAERAAASTIEDQRRAVGADYVLWARLPTQMISQEEISQWLDHARASSVRAEALFDAALSPRGARSMRADGYFEIYAHKDDKAKLDDLGLDLGR